MLKAKIGLNAGLVWKSLEKEQTNLKALKKATKLTDKDLYLALGWLAREGKISFSNVEEDMLISLA